MAVVKVRKNGQLVLDRELVEQIGAEPGQDLEVAVEGDHLTLRPAQERVNPFLKWVGYLGDGTQGDVDEMIEEMRGR